MEAEGHAVLEAGDGVEALALLARRLVDAVISDIFMPQMDGYRFCDEVRRSERLGALPFILHTATFTAAKDRQLGLEAGADAYLIKPVPMPVLRKHLAAAHRKAAQRRSKPPASQPAPAARAVRTKAKAAAKAPARGSKPSPKPPEPTRAKGGRKPSQPRSWA